MAKQKTAYFCSSCGCEEPKWFGRCPSCGEWGTCVEEVVSADGAIGRKPKSSGGVQWSHAGALGLPGQKEKPHKLREIEATEDARIDMHDAELNRVLGGGLVKGSMVLLGGDPGIGKSTLLLQTVMNLADRKVLYCSGEESAYQLKLRALRLAHDGQMPEDCFVACETNLDQIFVNVANLNPDILIVDSIQTIATDDLESSAGSV
ncbi:MAG: AAA family ATPase, partial [Bacteroidales bacterium]|nr:AAA family ATPase [Bacteroidales bacterium]